MTNQSLQFPKFYVTAATPCAYLEGREERKVFTELKGGEAQSLNDALSRVGFRRSQQVAYRPACENCNACISVRVLALEFEAKRSMRKIIRANADLVARPVDTYVSGEQYSLLKHYLDSRHATGGMAGMDIVEYADMVENSPVNTTLVEYRKRELDPEKPKSGPLLGVCLTDVMADGLSMVYSFYNPEEADRSLGTYMILDHIKKAQKAGLRHVYLGYWIEDSKKMAYKIRFQPLERLGPDGWHLFTGKK